MRILLFAGTTEGRRLAELLGRLPMQVYVSTATEYGKECVEAGVNAEVGGNAETGVNAEVGGNAETGVNVEAGVKVEAGANIEVMSGRMDEQAIAHFMDEHQIEMAVDATHPFAKVVSGNIRNACATCRKEYVRCLREKQDMTDLADGNVVFKPSVEEAVAFLKETEGNVFISTGSKELKLYTQLENYQQRCCARVLSTPEAVQESAALGFQGSKLIAMQGPFTKELNVAMLKSIDARYFVTKESGKAGGFEEKIQAAKETGAILVVITRPEEAGLGLEETLKYIKKRI